MTERWYRTIQGVYLLVALYNETDVMIYAFLAVLTFEAVSNFRIPQIVTRLRYGANSLDEGSETGSCFLHVDSERILRVVVFLFLLVSYILIPEAVWFFPWFVAAMLLLAGITNICPMVMLFQYMGFR